ncbi:MAG TPA: VCBS repeat-containing protein, partial [Isosphaeraceae bacterium]|nr:VCBS repeat-containing protein [Isosphaeraceae bacterium]
VPGLSSVDVNGDLKPALLISNAFGDVLVLAGQGDGTFRPLSAAGQNLALAAADLNGNGQTDFIFADPARDSVSVQFGGPTPAPFAGPAEGLLAPGAVKLADLNGDGIPDLIVANSGGNNVLVYPGLGHGRFGPEINGGQGFFTGTDPVGITVADLGNGRPDLVIADKGSNDVTILLNQTKVGGGFTFIPGPRLKAGKGPVATAVQVVNGIPDILVSNSLSNNVYKIPGVGGGFFNDENPTIYPVGINPGPIFVGNFDGAPGFATVNAGSDDVSVVSDLQGTPAFASYSTGGTDPEAAFMVPSASEFDSLVVANNGDGVFSLLEGGASGLTLTSTLSMPGLPSPTSLAFSTLSGGQVEFYAATSGVEAATLVQLSAIGNVASLVPLRDSALALVATLLTVTLESPGNGEGVGSVPADMVASFLPGTSVLVTQTLAKKSGDGGSDGEDFDLLDDEDVATGAVVAQAAANWERFVIGLDEALEEVREEFHGRFFGDEESRTGPTDLEGPMGLRALDEAAGFLWVKGRGPAGPGSVAPPPSETVGVALTVAAKTRPGNTVP